MNPSIKTLAEHVVNQIKAGEVIERPANIVKEILENSLDAGATKLELHIIGDGLSQISLSDNGHGIKFDNLPLAFHRHATSKLENFDDIYSVNTFGFRGEALASIASVAKISCQSTDSTGSASSIEIEGGSVNHHLKLENKPHSGTALYIKDLFFNTPVRLKFSQSQRSEKRQINKTIKTFLLSNPNIDFNVRWDDQDKKIYPGADYEKRISSVFYKSKKNELPLLTNQKEYDSFKVRIYISQDSTSGFAHKEQFLFVNGRYFENKQIHNLICRNLSHIWPERMQGHYAVYIELPQHKVDVNIHPQKTQVKFQETGTLLSIISQALKSIPSPYSSAPTNESEGQAPRTSEQLFGSTSTFFSNKDLSKKFTPNHNSFESSQELLTDTWQQILTIGDRFIILKSPQSVAFVLDSYKLASSQFEDAFNKEDLEITPLLISEMIKFNSITTEQLEQLKLKGFELDQLQGSQYALRTIPQFLLNFHYPSFLKNLLEHIYQGNLSGFDFESMPYNTLSNLNEMIELNLSSFIKDKTLVELTNQKIALLWK